MLIAEIFDAVNPWFFYLGVPLAYLLVPPLLILFTFRQDANPVLQEVDADLPLPDEVRRYFYTAHEQFFQLGYENVGTFLLPNQMENVRAILVLFVHRQQMEAGISVVMYAKIGDQWKIQTKYVEFCSSFADESTICTGNQRQAGSFPIPDQNLSTIHPDIQNIGSLCQAHRALVKTNTGSRRLALRIDSKFRGDAAAYLVQGMIDEFEFAKQRGYLRLVHGDHTDTVPATTPIEVPEASGKDSYKATIKGAYLMTWKELWPIKQILIFRRTRHDRRLLEETGFHPQA